MLRPGLGVRRPPLADPRPVVPALDTAPRLMTSRNRSIHHEPLLGSNAQVGGPLVINATWKRVGLKPGFASSGLVWTHTSGGTFLLEIHATHR